MNKDKAGSSRIEDTFKAFRSALSRPPEGRPQCPAGDLVVAQAQPSQAAASLLNRQATAFVNFSNRSAGIEPPPALCNLRQTAIDSNEA